MAYNLHNNITRKSIIQKVPLHISYLFRVLINSLFPFYFNLHCRLFNFHSRYWFTIGLLKYLVFEFVSQYSNIYNVLLLLYYTKVIYILQRCSYPLWQLFIYIYIFSQYRWTLKGSFATTTLISIDFFSSCY